MLLTAKKLEGTRKGMKQRVPEIGKNEEAFRLLFQGLEKSMTRRKGMSDEVE